MKTISIQRKEPRMNGEKVNHPGTIVNRVTVHTPDVFRVHPGGHGFSRCTGTANHRAAPATQPRGSQSRGRFPRRRERQPVFLTSSPYFGGGGGL